MPALSAREQRYFDLFCKYTIPQLAGGFESAFWQVLIPRASLQVPCIGYAATALAALHEGFAQGRDLIACAQPTCADSNFTMAQYGKAIQALLALVRETGDGATEVVLSMCILFICFELIRGNYDAVLLHTQSGMNVLTDVISTAQFPQKSRPSLIPLSAIAPVFTRIDVQASDILNAAPKGRFERLTQPPPPSAVPEAFTSLEHSKQCLLEHQNYFMYKVGDVVSISGSDSAKWPNHDRDRLHLLRSEYLKVEDRWYDVHQEFARQNCNTPEAHRASNILLVHYLFLKVALLRFPGTDEMDFDDYTDLFSTLVEAAENVLLYPLETDSGERLTLSFDLGIAEPLFYVVSRCRHPRLRRMALKLLRQCPSSEGIWNTSLASAIGDRIISAEERGSPAWPDVHTPADVPRAARIFEVVPKFIKNTADLRIIFSDMYGNRRDEKITWPGPDSDKFLASRAQPKFPLGKYQRSVKHRLRLRLNHVQQAKRWEDLTVHYDVQSATPPVEPIISTVAHPNHAFHVESLAAMSSTILNSHALDNDSACCSQCHDISTLKPTTLLVREKHLPPRNVLASLLDTSPIMGRAYD